VIILPFQFEVGEHDLSLISKAQLDVTTALRNAKTQTILIHGHSDSQTFAGYAKTKSDYLNWQLSQKRAESVKAALAQRGLLNNRMKTIA